MNRKIEAVIVCKNYSDYLKITLPLNKKYFDNIVIVTSVDDIETQDLCKKYNISYVIYNDFNKNNAKFNFGGARSYGLQNLKYNDWVIIMDGDIIISNNFRELFDINKNDINKFYGSYRRFIPSIKDYSDLINNIKSINDFEAIEGSGCGFFQCVNLNSIIVKNYGIAHLYRDSYSAEEVDIDFLKLWCPLIGKDPNLVRTNIELWHLGTSDGRHHQGKNVIDNFFNYQYDNNMANNSSSITLIKSKITSKDGDLFFFYPQNDTTAIGTAHGLIQNEYTKNLYKINFQENDVILDLGCNVGLVSMALAKLFPQVKIYAFDPGQIGIECLKLGCIQNNITNIQPFQFAVGTENKRNVKFFSTDEGVSCLIEEKSMDISDTKTKFSLLNLISIDELFDSPLMNIDRVKYMKVDIEAKEFELFDYLFEKRPDILDRIDFLNVEIHPFNESPKSKRLQNMLKEKFKDKVFF
jgi:FkbM family methyltransferase